MMDSVDDIHAAEEFAAMAVAALRELLAIPLATGRPALSRLIDGTSSARVVIAAWANYCRPTCNPLDEGPHDEVCQEGATCGCPCRSRQPSTTSGL